MIEDIPYREFLVDSYALAYLYSLEEKDLLVLLLSKFKFHVSTLSLYEFLTYIYFKIHDYTKISSIVNFLLKVHVVDEVNTDIAIKASMITSDLLKHRIPYEIIDVVNTAISLVKNIPILTDNPDRYKTYLKYGITAYSIEDFIVKFKKLLEERKL